MVACEVCGTGDQFLFQCQHCKGQFCQQHKAIENHDCDVEPRDTRIFSSPDSATSVKETPSVEPGDRYELPSLATFVDRVPSPSKVLAPIRKIDVLLPSSQTILILASFLLLFGIVVGSVAVFEPVLRDAFPGVLGGSTSGDPNAVPAEELNKTSVERMIADRINAFRANHDTATVEYAPALAEIARYHSEDMADRNYTGHVGPDNESVVDRFNKFNYSCDSPNELILFTQYNRRIETFNESRRFTDESELANGVVELWLLSTEHRQALLSTSWDQVGVGVHVTEENWVFVTLNAC